MTEVLSTQAESQEFDPQTYFESIRQTLDFAQSLEAANLEVPKGIINDLTELAGKTSSKEISSGGHTIQGTNEWIPGQTDTYFYLDVSDKAGEPSVRAIDKDLHDKINAFSEAHKPITTEVTGTDEGTNKPKEQSSTPKTLTSKKDFNNAADDLYKRLTGEDFPEDDTTQESNSETKPARKKRPGKHDDVADFLTVDERGRVRYDDSLVDKDGNKLPFAGKYMEKDVIEVFKDPEVQQTIRDGKAERDLENKRHADGTLMAEAIVPETKQEQKLAKLLQKFEALKASGTKKDLEKATSTSIDIWYMRHELGVRGDAIAAKSQAYVDHLNALGAESVEKSEETLGPDLIEQLKTQGTTMRANAYAAYAGMEPAKAAETTIVDELLDPPAEDAPEVEDTPTESEKKRRLLRVAKVVGRTVATKATELREKYGPGAKQKVVRLGRLALVNLADLNLGEVSNRMVSQQAGAAEVAAAVKSHAARGTEKGRARIAGHRRSI